MTNEQIAQTVWLLRNHDNNVFLTPFGQAQIMPGRQHAGEILNIRQRRGLTGKLRPHKEAPGFVVNKFAVGHDVQAATKKHAGDLVDDTGFVRAIDGENVVLHVEANPLPRRKCLCRCRESRTDTFSKRRAAIGCAAMSGMSLGREWGQNSPLLLLRITECKGPTATVLQLLRCLEARAPCGGCACNPGAAPKSANFPLSRPTLESESALPARPTRSSPPG